MQIEPRLRRGALVVLLAPSRQRDQQHGAPPRLAANRSCHLVTVQLGEADVEEHDLRAEFGGDLNRLEAVVGQACLVTTASHEQTEARCRVDVVVDDEDARSGSGDAGSTAAIAGVRGGRLSLSRWQLDDELAAAT